MEERGFTSTGVDVAAVDPLEDVNVWKQKEDSSSSEDLPLELEVFRAPVHAEVERVRNPLQVHHLLLGPQAEFKPC